MALAGNGYKQPEFIGIIAFQNSIIIRDYQFMIVRSAERGPNEATNKNSSSNLTLSLPQQFVGPFPYPTAGSLFYKLTNWVHLLTIIVSRLDFKEHVDVTALLGRFWPSRQNNWFYLVVVLWNYCDISSTQQASNRIKLEPFLPKHSMFAINKKRY